MATRLRQHLSRLPRVAANDRARLQVHDHVPRDAGGPDQQQGPSSPARHRQRSVDHFDMAFRNVAAYSPTLSAGRLSTNPPPQSVATRATR
mgnify:CR=1 FL=1